MHTASTDRITNNSSCFLTLFDQELWEPGVEGRLSLRLRLRLRLRLGARGGGRSEQGCRGLLGGNEMTGWDRAAHPPSTLPAQEPLLSSGKSQPLQIQGTRDPLGLRLQCSEQGKLKTRHLV